MTRIIAGRLGGRRLHAPSGDATRPTSDRVRESLFSSLEALGVIDGARVLDLCTGTGALGLEALSRGAASAVLVDRARPAVKAVQRNVAELGLGGIARVVAADARTAVAGLQGPVDLVFADPPYPMPEAEIAELLEALAPKLSPEAVVIVERSARSPEPTLPDALERFREKRIGETALHYLQPVGLEP